MGPIPSKYSAKQLALRPLLAPANISPDSFLATDYLNHFNEIVMTLEMAVDMPELMEDAREWEPVSYTQHFEQSGFADKELVIKAYEIAPTSTRCSFEEVVELLDQVVMDSIVILSIALKSDFGLTEREGFALEEKRLVMHDLLGQLNGIIHSGGEHLESPSVEESDAHSQDEIDQLFD